MNSDSQPSEQTMPTRAQQVFTSWTRDVLVYLVVLNLFVEWVDAIVIDSYTISIFTAIVLKALLDVIQWAEDKVAHYFEQRTGKVSKVLRVFFTWLVLFTSKFLILEVIDFIFGEHVELGSFVHVLSLVLTMMVVRALVERFYEYLGRNQSESADSA